MYVKEHESTYLFEPRRLSALAIYIWYPSKKVHTRVYVCNGHFKVEEGPENRRQRCSLRLVPFLRNAKGVEPRKMAHTPHLSDFQRSYSGILTPRCPNVLVMILQRVVK